MAPVEAAAAEMMREHLAAFQGLDLPELWIGTGGTFTALAALSRRIPWTDRTYTQGTCLTAEQIRGMGMELAPLTPEERMKISSLQPSRADIVVHGICILLGVMDRLGIERRDAGKLQTMHETAVGKAVHTGSRIDTGDPEGTELSLLLLSSGIGACKGSHNGLFCHSILF